MCCAFQLLIRINRSAPSCDDALASRVHNETNAAIDTLCVIPDEKLAMKALVPVGGCGEKRDIGAFRTVDDPEVPSFSSRAQGMPCVEGVNDSRYEELGCLDPREMVEVDSGVNGDVASEASANASQGGSCIRSYVAEATRRVGAGGLGR